ncbi:MAG: glycine cleavage system aminomethyltransferase GcvT [Candidatus Sumerlaeaceae bacterium]|nr:glycine cleavage system aminomethyltransferase GcvT [Candidatus Sumerlaeaceae bacterium]
MRQTPLHDWHVAHKACMTDFNGWHMPLYYSGMTEEHNITRTSTGLFDLGHMGRVMVRGVGARSFLDNLTPAQLSKAKPGDVQYSFLLAETGCPIDDITIYTMSHTEYMLVVNAGNHDRAVAWIEKQAAHFGAVEIEDRSYSWGMIAVQGPEAEKVFRTVVGDSFPALSYYTFAMREDDGRWPTCIISATGYTGERGYEIYMPISGMEAVWTSLFDAGAKPIGLGARDSLRLEAAMPLYGHELTDATTPLAAGLGKFLDLEKGDFIGRAALLAQKEAGGPARKLIGFELTQRGPIARQGFDVCNSDGMKVGSVTSGIFSPTLQKTIGMAYIDAASAAVGSSLTVDIRGRKLPCIVVKKPFYKRSA